MGIKDAWKVSLHRLSIAAPVASTANALSLSKAMAVRLAACILKQNADLVEFEVELGDTESCVAVAEELRANGCHVKQHPFRFLLNVSKLQDVRSHQAA